MKFVEAQLLMQLAWTLRDHAAIVSGAYKLHKTQVGYGTNPDGTMQFRDCTEEEKLRNAMETMTNHCHFVSECADYIGEHQNDTTDNETHTTGDEARDAFREMWNEVIKP